MSGIKDTTVRMSRRRVNQMISDVRRSHADAQRAHERENAAEAARRRAEQKNSELTSQLRQAQQNASKIEQEAERKISRMEQETNRQMSEVRTQVEGIRREQNQRLERMSQENTARLNQQARDFQSRLNKQSEQFNSRLENQRNEYTSMVNEVKTDLAEQGQRLSRKIEQNRRELKQSIDEISGRVSQMQQMQQNHKELAELWISEAASVFREVEEYRHELFAPGRLAALRSLLQDSKSDIENQAYETAIGSARSVFRDSIGLKEDVVNGEMEWNSWYSLFSQLYTETKSNLEDLGSVQFEFQVYNEDGEEETAVVDADIDYWTSGKLQILRNQFAEIEQRFGQAENCTSSQLQGMMNELAHMQEMMDHLEADSRICLQLSQERRDLACDIVEALSDGFSFDMDSSIGTYAGNEMRDSYEGTIRNPVTNDQVSFRISPKENEEGLLTNQMELHYFSDSNQEVLDGQMLDAITQAIGGNGISLGEMRCREGYEHCSSDQKELLRLQP